MKKFVALLAVICLAFAIFTGCDTAANDEEAPAGSAAPTAAAESAEESPAAETDGATADETETAAESAGVDYAALYASHEPDEVVMTLGGRDVTWEEYFYCFNSQASQIENYFTQMSYYGLSASWDDDAGDGQTYAELCGANAETMLRQLIGMEDYAEDNGLTLDAEDEKALDEQLQSDIESVAGEDGTEEDLDAALESIYLPRALYDRINETNIFYTKGFEAKYGADGGKVSDADALKYLDDQGYLSAAHILLMTIDPDTRESLSDEEIAEKKAMADKLYEELSAIEDADKRAARFKELKEQYCEDSGKESYPDGYVFTEGTMVTEFEDTVKSLEAGEIAAPVESSYGYHIIMRLAPSAERTVTYDNSGTPLNARYLCAADKYSAELQTVFDGEKLEYADGFAAVDVRDYIK